MWRHSVGSFYCQIRNGKQTAILAVAVESAKGKKDTEKNKKDQFYTIYRPNTGLQVQRFTAFRQEQLMTFTLHFTVLILIWSIRIQWPNWYAYMQMISMNFHVINITYLSLLTSDLVSLLWVWQNRSVSYLVMMPTIIPMFIVIWMCGLDQQFSSAVTR
jgi:hypothetical protein